MSVSLRLPPPIPDYPRWVADKHLPGCATGDDHGAQSNQTILPKFNAVPDRRVRSYPRPGTDSDAATKVDACHDTGLPPDVTVVRDMDMIVDSHVVLDDRGINGPNADGHERTNVNPGTDDDPSDVRQPNDSAPIIALNAESLSSYDTVLTDGAGITNPGAWQEAHSGSNGAMGTNLDIVIDCDCPADDTPIANAARLLHTRATGEFPVSMVCAAFVHGDKALKKAREFQPGVSREEELVAVREVRPRQFSRVRNHEKGAFRVKRLVLTLSPLFQEHESMVARFVYRRNRGQLDPVPGQPSMCACLQKLPRADIKAKVTHVDTP